MLVGYAMREIRRELNSMYRRKHRSAVNPRHATHADDKRPLLRNKEVHPEALKEH